MKINDVVTVTGNVGRDGEGTDHGFSLGTKAVIIGEARETDDDGNETMSFVLVTPEGNWQMVESRNLELTGEDIVVTEDQCRMAMRSAKDNNAKVARLFNVDLLTFKSPYL